MRIKRKCCLCDAEYWTGNGKAKYCSDACRKRATQQRQAQWRKEHPDYHKDYVSNHPEVMERFKENHPDYERDRWRKIRGSVEYKRICVICGKEFTTFFDQGKTCSKECGRKLKNQKRAGRIRSKYSLRKVFDTYGGICQICGKACDWNDMKIVNGVKCIGNNYPTIDHIIPVSSSGEDSLDNIQLAHMICNVNKGA